MGGGFGLLGLLSHRHHGGHRCDGSLVEDGRAGRGGSSGPGGLLGVLHGLAGFTEAHAGTVDLVVIVPAVVLALGRLASELARQAELFALLGVVVDRASGGSPADEGDVDGVFVLAGRVERDSRPAPVVGAVLAVALLELDLVDEPADDANGVLIHDDVLSCALVERASK